MKSYSYLSLTAPTITFVLSVVLLTLAVLLGGGQGGLGDTTAQLLALILLGWLGWLGMRGELTWRIPSWLRWLPILVLLLPILQLLPVPEIWWQAAPARAELAAQLAQVGVPAHLSLSLNAAATERALWSLLPACALFLATATLAGGRQRALLGCLLGLAIASVVLGMAQLADGPDSVLRFYLPTNPTEAVGFFANRNHLATLLVMALPVAITGMVWAVGERFADRPRSLFLIMINAGAVVLLILGIALTHSRTGLLLGMLAVLGSLPIALALRRQTGARRVLAIVLGVAVMLSVQFALLGILQRLETDPLDDGRWKYAAITREAAQEYAPLGSGLGTFRQAYQPYEARHEPGQLIVNHAHNDYLEIWLEGGWPALALMALAGVAWLMLGITLWRRAPEAGMPGHRSRLWARATWLAGSLALLHSAFDYPLRTTANMAVFALLTAIAGSGLRVNAAHRSPGATRDQPRLDSPAGG